MTSEARCPSCGAAVGEEAARCPDCGAPIGRRKAAFGRARLAASILALLFLLAAFQTAFVLDDPVARSVPTPAGFGDVVLSGVVRDATGNPASGVAVSAGAATNTTDAAGGYRVGGLGVGVHEVRFVGPDNETLVLRIFLTRDRTADVSLPGPGTVATADHPSVTPVLLASKLCGGLLVGVGLLTAAGAVAAWRQRRWGLVLTAAIAGAFASLPLSIVLSGIAVYVVVAARKEFGR
ncbi:MAG: carboxypeptidase regulatory-like domain-containing protein [Euryarchaeota archaeon]|nr:carboxypeptidase regulatory-like domain-containing protein [Euryarchaeota archaeon]